MVESLVLHFLAESNLWDAEAPSEGGFRRVWIMSQSKYFNLLMLESMPRHMMLEHCIGMTYSCCGGMSTAADCVFDAKEPSENSSVFST
jgi:hypothetical protein